MTTRTRGYDGRLRDAELQLVRRQRDRAVHGGGTWQAWQRVLDVLEGAKRAQDATAATPDGLARQLLARRAR